MELRLRELLYLLLRLSVGEETAEKTAAEIAMGPVLLYIRDNLHRNISLEDLAAAAQPFAGSLSGGSLRDTN